MALVPTWFSQFYSELHDSPNRNIEDAFEQYSQKPSVVPLLLHDFITHFPRFDALQSRLQQGVQVPRRERARVQRSPIVPPPPDNVVLWVRSLKYTVEQVADRHSLFQRKLYKFSKLTPEEQQADPLLKDYGEFLNLIQQYRTAFREQRKNLKLGQHKFFPLYVQGGIKESVKGPESEYFKNLGKKSTVTPQYLEVVWFSDAFQLFHFGGMMRVEEDVEEKFLRQFQNIECTQSNFKAMLYDLTELRPYQSIEGEYHYSSPFFMEGFPRLVRGVPLDTNKVQAFNKTEVRSYEDLIWLMLDWFMQESVVMHEALRQFIMLTEACGQKRIERPPAPKAIKPFELSQVEVKRDDLTPFTEKPAGELEQEVPSGYLPTILDYEKKRRAKAAFLTEGNVLKP